MVGVTVGTVTIYKRTGRTPTEIVEHYDHIPANCRACGKPLKAPNVSLGTTTCVVHGRTRDHTCLSCLTVHVDCSCADVVASTGGSAYS